MNTIKFRAVLLSTAALLSASFAALAQQQPTPPFKGAAVPQPRQNTQTRQNNAQPPVVQEGRKAGDYLCTIAIDVQQYYLKLDKEQTAKIDPLVKRVRTEIVKLQTIGGDDPTKLVAQVKLLQQLFKSSDEEIDAALTSEQKKKADKMFDEVRKLGAVGIDRDSIAQVKLTDDQKKKLLALSDEYQKKRAEIKPEERQTEAPRLGREYRDKASVMLTDEQKQIVEKARQNNQLTRRPKTP